MCVCGSRLEICSVKNRLIMELVQLRNRHCRIAT